MTDRTEAERLAHLANVHKDWREDDCNVCFLIGQITRLQQERDEAKDNTETWFQNCLKEQERAIFAEKERDAAISRQTAAAVSLHHALEVNKQLEQERDADPTPEPGIPTAFKLLGKTPQECWLDGWKAAGEKERQRAAREAEALREERDDFRDGFVAVEKECKAALAENKALREEIGRLQELFEATRAWGAAPTQPSADDVERDIDRIRARWLLSGPETFDERVDEVSAALAAARAQGRSEKEPK